MTKFIYFSHTAIASFDPYCRDQNYQHSHWFNIKWPTSSYLNSRVHQLDTPWDLTSTLFPIPKSKTVGNFSQTVESIADQFCKQVLASSKTPYLYWSGGIDSTLILVSLLKVANREFLDRLVILCDNESIEENAYFYYRYIDQQLKTISINEFKITEDNYNQIIILDGEGGNQCLCGHSISLMCHLQKHDLLDQKWADIDFDAMGLSISKFNIELIQETIGYCPVEVTTLYDFIWWSNFNFKFDNAMIRKMLVYGKHLSTTQRQHFWQHSLYRFFAQEEMQVWSMNNLNQRREFIRLDPKYIVKKYIYDFDHNHHWFAFKSEQGSLPAIFKLQTLPVIGITDQWRTVSISDPGIRQYLKEILNR